MSDEKKNKIFWLTFFFLIIVVVASTYARVYLRHDYMIRGETACDPASESCFVYTEYDLCEDSENADCIHNTEPQYYKIIHKKASNIKECVIGEEEEECEIICEEGELKKECYYEYYVK